MTELQNKAYLAKIKKAQEAENTLGYLHRCPRCGINTLDKKIYHNALSRHEDVHICHGCGTEETLLDYAGKVLPLSEWFAVKSLALYGEFPAHPTLLAIDPEVEGDCIVTTFECWFDAAAKFGVKLAARRDDAWINLYAAYNVVSQDLTMFFTVDDNATYETIYYVPTEKEHEAVIENMEKCCQHHGFDCMAAMVAHYAEEDC